MSDRDDAKLNQPRQMMFEIFDPATGLPKPGVDPSTLTVALFRNAVTPSSPIPSVVITEVGSGRYLATYTPNVTGYWYLSVRDPVNNPQGWVDEINCVQVLLDDFISGSSTVITTIANAVLTYPLSNIEVAIRGVRCLGSVIQRIRNKVARSNTTTFSIYESDNSTVAWTATVGTDPNQPPVVSETPN